MSEPRTAANDWKQPGLTASVLIRRGIFALVAIVSLAAMALAALPLVASTQLVRNRIAIELSAWSGFRVAIASTPQIEVWPTFKAVLNGVTLYQWGDWDNPAVIEAERLEIDLSAIDALNGNVSFTKAKLINPVVRIGPETVRPGPESIGSSGRIAQAVDMVRDLVAADPDNPDLSRFPTTPFGAFDIQNGRVVTMVDGEQQDMVTRLGGYVDWPSLNSGGRASLSGIWRGEEVKLDLSSESPLALFAGAATKLAAQWESGPFKGRIDGTMRLAGQGRLKAHVTLEAPSVRRAIAWTGSDLSIGSALGSLKLDGDIAGNRDHVVMGNAQLIIDDEAGSGTLSLKPLAARPELSGSLVFQKLDLPSLAAGFTPLMSYDRPSDRRVVALADLMDAHIRIASTHATVGSIEASDVSGAVDVDRQSVGFVIDSSKVFGGTLSGALRLKESLDRKTITIEVNAVDVDGAAVAEAIALSQIVPEAKGDLTLDITGRGHALDAVPGSASGIIVAHFGKGDLRGIDLSGLISKTVDGGFFPLTEISKGAVAMDSAELDATLTDGVGRIRKALITSGQKAISLSGILPYAGRGVALSGAVTSQDKISLLNPFGREATFFVGGSWDAPFVSAALPSQLPQ